MNKRNEGPLLEFIPRNRLSRRQKALRPARCRDELSMYKMLREPTRLDEFDWDEYHGIAIWREKGSLIFISHEDFESFWARNIRFTLNEVSDHCLCCAIYGENDVAFADTAKFFLSLTHREDADVVLKVYQHPEDYDREPKFNFAAVQPEQLTQILLHVGTWNSEQSIVLATRRYTLNLKLDGCYFSFVDGGSSFVDALENRQTTFGSLHIACRGPGQPFNLVTLRRIVGLETLGKLGIRFPDRECFLLPFATNVDSLDYGIDALPIQPEDFESLNIVTRDLTFKLFVHHDDAWNILLIALLDRVAQLGHFKKLCISIEHMHEDIEVNDFIFDEVAPVVAALIRAIRANPELTSLDLSDTFKHLHWGPNLQSVFEAIEEHECLRTLAVQKYTWSDDADDNVSDEEEFERLFNFDRSWLERLLSRNRNIEVVNYAGQRCSNGPVIDNLYSLNYFYNGSAGLVSESASSRPLLMVAALTERASENFQYTALSLAQHTDVLCEFIHGVNLEDAASPASFPEEPSPKRKSPAQPSLTAKRLAREEP